MSYVAAAQQLYSGGGSAGNGAAMRVAPVAIAGFPDGVLTKRQARLQANITHAHPEGADAAVLLAAVQHLALRTPGEQRLDIHQLHIEDSDLESERMRAAVARLRTLLTPGEDRHGPSAFRTSSRAVESVPAAIALALQHQVDVAATAKAAIVRGGDTDTVAAMAASIVGAHSGSSAIPGGLRTRLEQQDRIERVAGQLVRLASARARRN